MMFTVISGLSARKKFSNLMDQHLTVRGNVEKDSGVGADDYPSTTLSESIALTKLMKVKLTAKKTALER